MRRSKVPILCALLPLLALLGASCGDDGDGGDDPEPPETTVEDELDLDDAARLTVEETDVQVAVGDLVVVELSENSSVGDQWEISEEPDGAVLEFVDESFELEGEEDCAGCGGTLSLVFEAVGDGTTTFTVENCFRCTSEGEPSETPPEPAEVTFSVQVAA